MTFSREQVREVNSDLFTVAEQLARYGLAQCCECRRFLPKRHLGLLDPQGQQRCANWSDCRDARAMAEACYSQARAIDTSDDLHRSLIEP